MRTLATTDAARLLVLSARLLIGSLWGGALVALGALFLSWAQPPLLASTWLWLGLAALASGNWLFLVAVANRIAPVPDQRVPYAAELALVLTIAISFTIWLTLLI